MSPLRPSEATYRVLYEDNPSMYFAVDRGGRVVSVNRFGAEQLGYEVADLIGQPVTGVFHPEDREAVGEQLASCLASPGQAFEWELRKVRRDGEVMWVREHARAIATERGDIVLVVCEDITSRHRAEEALRESRERYRRLYTRTPAMLHSFDRDLVIVDVSRHWLEVMGYERDEVIGRQIVDFLTDDERRRALDVDLPSFVEAGEVRDLEYEMVKKNGEIIDVLVSATADVDAEGAINDSLVVLVDVTERKRAQRELEAARREMERRVEERTAELHQSRERFRQLVETVRVIPWEATVDGDRLTYVGPQVEELLGFPHERWLEPGFRTSRVHPDDREPVLAAYADAVSEGDGRDLEYRMLAADDRVVWVHETVDVVDSTGSEALLRGFMFDVTERKRAEQELESQRSFLRQVIDVTPNFIFAKDREGRFTLVNRAVADAYGTTVEDLTGKTDADFNPNREEVEYFRRKDLEVIDGERELFIPEESFTDANGQVRFLQTVKRRLVRDDGRAEVLGSATDITARRVAEERLRRSEAALRQSQRDLRELAGRLLAAQEVERRRLAREVHDDLAQRLAVLAILAGRLEQESEGLQRDDLRRIREMRDALVQLSDDVHALSRQLHPSILEELGLEDALRTECDSFSRRSGIDVSFECDVEVPETGRDVGLCLYRITQEALRNVAKHAEVGDARVSLRAAGDGVRLIVEDEGRGFEPSVGGGGGIGLASMEERARLVDAELVVVSSPGRGTTIEVRVPRAADPD